MGGFWKVPLSMRKWCIFRQDLQDGQDALRVGFFDFIHCFVEYIITNAKMENRQKRGLDLRLPLGYFVEFM